MLINITKINLNPNVGGGKPIELESKEITITENGTTTVTPSEGFGGLSSVDITTDVPTPQIQANKTISITENGAYTVTPSTGYVGVGDVDISVFVSEIGTSIDFSEIGYNATDNANANMIIQDGINYAKQIQAEYTDDKTYSNDNNLVYFPNIDTSNRTSCKNMFLSNLGNYNFKYVPPLTISNKCTDLSGMFQFCYGLKNIDTTNWDTSNVITFSGIFRDSKNLDIIGIENWDTSNCTSFSEMGISCPRHLDLSNWNTSKITSMYRMFKNGIKSIDTTGWDTSKVTGDYASFNSMFRECTTLENVIGIENWDISNATSIDSMFMETGLKSLDLSRWDTSKITKYGGGSIGGLFKNSSQLTDVNISNWVINNSSFCNAFYSCDSLETVNMSNMTVNTDYGFESLFAYCQNLKNIIGLDTINFTVKLKKIDSIFNQCISLTDLNLSTWDVGEVSSLNYFIGYDSRNKLTNFQAPQNINAYIDFSYCKLLTVDSLLSILNNLTDRTSTTSLTCNIGSTNLKKLTDEQKAIATSKNWVLA